MNVINSAFVLFHIINMSSIYLRYSRDISLACGQMCFASNLAIKMLTQDGAHIVMAQPIVCKQCVQLNTKLFKLKIKLRKVIITFVDTVYSLYFSLDFLTAFMPSLFGMFVEPLTSTVTAAPPLSAFAIIISSRSLSFLSLFIRLLYGFSFVFRLFFFNFPLSCFSVC